MNSTGAKLAFQLDPGQNIKHAIGDNDVLASRKADIQMKDGSTRKVTLFFRAQPDELTKLQSEGRADSSQATAARLKTLLLKQGANIIQVEQLFRRIRVHNHSSEKTEAELKQRLNGQTVALKRQKSLSQLAAKKMEDGWAKTFAAPDFPMGLVGSVFTKAINDGKMLRVDSQMQESEPKPATDVAAPSDGPGTGTGTVTTTLATQSTTTTTHTTTTPAVPPSGMPAIPPVPGSPSTSGPTPQWSISMIDNA